jgi:hypothetical protein
MSVAPGRAGIELDGGVVKRIISLRWKPSLAIVVCGLLGFFCPAVYAWCTTIPAPRVHDEFCYLLAADTFAHARLANSSPAIPEFFDAEHLLVVPTYMAKYPPGQGLCLAAGQVVFGHPIFGVWLTCAAFAASLCWMLKAWTAPRWALATTLAVILGSGLASYWCQSYWGGMAAAGGGALLFGGMRRTLRRPRVSSSLLMGLGIVVLASTRPFEGLLVSLPVAAAMLWWLATDHRLSFGYKFRRWLLPVGAICVAGAAGLATYNQAVTGDWRQMPYSLHERQYCYQGANCFSRPRIPERHPCDRIARFYLREKSVLPPGWAGMQRIAAHLTNRAQNLLAMAYTGTGFSDATYGYSRARLWAGLAAFAAVVIAGLRNRWFGYCCATIGLYLFGASLIWWWWPHYAAPVLPLLYAATGIALCRVNHSLRRRLAARRLFPALVVGGIFLLSVIGTAASRTSQLAQKLAAEQRADSVSGFAASRATLLQHLQDQSGGHLVFVRYGHDYPLDDEWVYNTADMNLAKVIFAHDLGDDENRRLIELCGSRTIWLATVTSGFNSVVPYDDRPR